MPPRDEGRDAGRDGKIRCFVAVDLARGVVAALAALTARLRAAGGDVRWVAAENLHVTLKFLGHLRQERLVAVRAAVRAAAAETAPFAVSVAGLGAFPSPPRARVAWVGLHGPEMGALAARVDAALARAGFAPEARAFNPHVTIGRVRTPRGWDQVLKAMQVDWETDFGESPVSEVVIYRSDLGRDGARYTALERVPLGPGAGERSGA
jgi:2'-5' RNA ligase